MEIKTYRKRPVVIEAMQFDGTEEAARVITQWVPGSSWFFNHNAIQIPTLEGLMIANIGDYIIKGIKGEFYPIKEEIFLATYEAVD